MSSLLVFAMKEEAADQFLDQSCLYTGIGKLNASYHLTKAIAEKKPSLIVNMGTAGSRKHRVGTIVNCTSFIQRDMDVRPLGFELGQTPFSSDSITLEYGETIPDITQGLCGSGDNFDVSESTQKFDVVDMEAYVLAMIAKRENIPFLCLKYVSDGADDEACQDWNESLKIAAKALRTILEEKNYV